MPELFGGAIGFPPSAIPLGLGRFKVTSGNSFAHGPFGATTGTSILTCIDMMSVGGLSGGVMEFSLNNSFAGVFRFVTFNIGSSEDSFSWRGFLPLNPNDTIQGFNDSDTQVELFLSGVFVRTEYFVQ